MFSGEVKGRPRALKLFEAPPRAKTVATLGYCGDFYWGPAGTAQFKETPADGADTALCGRMCRQRRRREKVAAARRLTWIRSTYSSFPCEAAAAAAAFIQELLSEKMWADTVLCLPVVRTCDVNVSYLVGYRHLQFQYIHTEFHHCLSSRLKTLLLFPFLSVRRLEVRLISPPTSAGNDASLCFCSCFCMCMHMNVKYEYMNNIIRE